MYSLFKKLITILSATGFYQIVNFLSLPFLTKAYNPSSFGSFYFCMSVSSVIYVFFNFKADWSIPKVKNGELESFLTLILIRTFSVFSILIVFSYWLGKKYFFIIILTLFFTLDETFFIYNNRKNRYSLNAVLQMFQCSLFVLLALFVFKNIKNGLIISYILSYLGPSIYNTSKITLVSFKQADYKNLFKCTRHQTAVMFGCFFQKFRLHMPNIFMPLCFDMTFAGVCGILTRLINSPTAILANKISDVVFQEFGTYIRENLSPQQLFKKLFSMLFFTSLFIFLSLFFMSDIVCDSFFSKNWNVRASYLHSLLLGAWAYFLYSCFKQVLILYNKTKYYFYWHLLFTLITMLIFGMQYLYGYGFQKFLNLISYMQAIFCLWNIHTVKKVIFSKTSASSK